MDQDSKPLAVKGIAEADYQGWKHHPVSKVLLQYLRDYHLALKEEAWQCLLRGPAPAGYLEEISGRARAVAELYELPFEAIVAFYQEEETNAA